MPDIDSFKDLPNEYILDQQNQCKSGHQET